ncbi:MAG: ABC transporter permease [Candidatus Kerfeldbacteria bacterium]|nr:ABC transporter permease [Candidatus Kerfeldbacteria bacterium]
MNTTLKLTGASIKMFARNRQALFFTLFMPVIIMTIFGLIGFDRVPKINVGIVVANPTPATESFLETITKIEAFSVTRGSQTDERTALEKGDRAVVLLLPDALLPAADARAAPQKQIITVLKNVGNEQQAQAALSIVQQILDKTTIAAAQAPELFALDIQSVNARNVRYIEFLLPGIVALSIMQMAVFSVAFVFVDYKEKGILKRLLATPMKPQQFVTANVITRLIVALVQSSILIVLGVLLYKAHVIGSIWLLAPIIILGAVMFLGLGFTISGMAKTVDAVPAIANLIVFPMLFLGGTFFPLESMPGWLQNIVQYLPLTYLSDALRGVMANGESFRDITNDLLFMTAWSIVLVALAVFTFRLEERRV